MEPTNTRAGEILQQLLSVPWSKNTGVTWKFILHLSLGQLGWLGERVEGPACLPLLLPPLSPLFRQFPAHLWFMGNACLRQKCPLTSHVKWTVRCWQEAAWKFSSWLGRCDDLCDDGSTQEPGGSHTNPFPAIPLSDYGGMPSWTLSVTIPFYRWGKWWLAEFYSKNDVWG